jgi:hypothetical protein
MKNLDFLENINSTLGYLYMHQPFGFREQKMHHFYYMTQTFFFEAIDCSLPAMLKIGSKLSQL